MIAAASSPNRAAGWRSGTEGVPLAEGGQDHRHLAVRHRLAGGRHGSAAVVHRSSGVQPVRRQVRDAPAGRPASGVAGVGSTTSGRRQDGDLLAGERSRAGSMRPSTSTFTTMTAAITAATPRTTIAATAAVHRRGGRLRCSRRPSLAVGAGYRREPSAAAGRRHAGGPSELGGRRPTGCARPR